MVTHPGESQAVDGIGQHVSQQRRPRSEGWVVGVHVGALPVYHLEAGRVHVWRQGACLGGFPLPETLPGPSEEGLTLVRQSSK